MNNIADDLSNAYSDGLRDGAPKWISVKDRLPEVWKDVLLVCNGKVYEGCMMSNGDFENARGYDLTNVTHWMPLPEPPGEEVEE